MPAAMLHTLMITDEATARRLRDGLSRAIRNSTRTGGRYAAICGNVEIAVHLTQEAIDHAAAVHGRLQATGSGLQASGTTKGRS